MAKGRLLRMAVLLGVLALFLVPLTVHAAEIGRGEVAISDGTGMSSKATINLINVADPGSGKFLVGWFISDDGKTKVSTGALTRTADGAIVDATYEDPKGENLLAKYNSFQITVESSATATTPSDQVLYSGTIASAGLSHIRHLLVSWDSNPDKKGIAVGLKQQAALALTHAKLAQDAAAQGDLAKAKWHSEHVVNIIEGSKGANFGDLDKDGKTDNPGDGLGVLVYADDAAKHARLAAEAAPTEAAITVQGAATVASANATKANAAAARDAALVVFNATDASIARLYLANVVAVLNRVVYGYDADADGVVEFTTAEAGAAQVYAGSQLMATMTVTPGAPKPPATGDINYGIIALGALALGTVLFVGGGYLYRRSRARA